MIKDTPEATLEKLNHEAGDEVMTEAVLEIFFHTIVGVDHPQTL